jgi:uncharacterized protein with PhoU and TrkA domain
MAESTVSEQVKALERRVTDLERELKAVREIAERALKKAKHSSQ